MIQIRRHDQRGHSELSWLNSQHTFSFGSYHDAKQMGFRALRVINEDQVIAGAGFATHGHRDMEILSYVLSGSLAHRDSMGTGAVLKPGDLQRMSAGTGIEHSEFNASNTESVHFLQIWILPERSGLMPSYEQKSFPAVDRTNRFQRLADRHGTDGALTIHQDVSVWAANLTANHPIQRALPHGRYAWLQVAQGQVQLGGHTLTAGDGVALFHEPLIKLSTDTHAEVLLFDLA
jgi:hypothetical protein